MLGYDTINKYSRYKPNCFSRLTQPTKLNCKVVKREGAFFGFEIAPSPLVPICELDLIIVN